MALTSGTTWNVHRVLYTASALRLVSLSPAHQLFSSVKLLQCPIPCCGFMVLLHFLWKDRQKALLLFLSLQKREAVNQRLTLNHRTQHHHNTLSTLTLNSPWWALLSPLLLLATPASCSTSFTASLCAVWEKYFLSLGFKSGTCSFYSILPHCYDMRHPEHFPAPLTVAQHLSLSPPLHCSAV